MGFAATLGSSCHLSSTGSLLLCSGVKQAGFACKRRYSFKGAQQLIVVISTGMGNSEHRQSSGSGAVVWKNGILATRN